MIRNLGMWIWFLSVSALATAGLFLILTNVAMPVGRLYEGRYLEAPDGSFFIVEAYDSYASTRLFILDSQAHTASFLGYTADPRVWSLSQLSISPDSQQIAHHTYARNAVVFYSPQGDFLHAVDVPSAISFVGVNWTPDSDGFAYAVAYRDWCGGAVGASRVTDLFFVQIAHPTQSLSFRLPCHLRLRDNAASRMYWSSDGQRFIFGVFDTNIDGEAFYMLDLSQSPLEAGVLVDGIDGISDRVDTRTGTRSGLDGRINPQDFTVINQKDMDSKRVLGMLMLVGAIMLMFARSRFRRVLRTAAEHTVHRVYDES